jgi:hypothetical protein
MIRTKKYVRHNEYLKKTTAIRGLHPLMALCWNEF